MLTMKMETKRFNAAIRNFMRQTKISEDKVLRKIAFDLLGNILRPEPYNTHPVDYGVARAGWYAASSGLGKSFDFESKLKSESKVEEGKQKGRYRENLTGSKKYIEMVNAVDYIMYLEYGWSKSAPMGMVRISMRKMRGRLPKELGKEYKDDWKKAFKSTPLKGSKSADFGGLSNVVRDFTEFGD